MFSKNWGKTIPLNGDWVYETLSINDNSNSYELPQNIIIHNISADAIMKYKIMTLAEGDGDTFEGVLLRNNSDQQIVDNMNLYRVGIAFQTPQVGDGIAYISATSYRKVVK